MNEVVADALGWWAVCAWTASISWCLTPTWCRGCQDQSLELDAASLRLDMAYAEASIQRIKDGVAW